ncbi:PD40 domain-containing protein [Carboxylicivirga mesophila]|uniref:PD40 domain-containing protein n=1 Tax=Carboxylicivirga mesophila TaxID=1166478 RepID=A0ABS5KCZ8_9BACT|nr:PD40 domain-containing protein [Carboxylicivirga mesophila]MBS2212878.1 PD40 domain-containing protein [Carboxylicivirga mesophila]
MIRPNALFVALFILIAQLTLAQSDKKTDDKKFNQAVKLADDKDFGEAIKLFSDILENEPNNVPALYNIGNCYLNTSDGPDTAIVFFQKAYSLLQEDEKIGDVGVDIQLSIGKSHQYLLEHEKAISMYEELITIIPAEDELLRQEALREIEICENAIELMQKPVQLKVKNLGPNINSKYDDHSPLITADQSMLFFTSRRASSYSELLFDGQYAERIYSSTKEEEEWDKAKSLKELFRRSGHEAGVSLSAEGTELIVYRNDVDGANLYICQYDGENWGEPVKMEEPINSKFEETHATTSADKQTMYFTSNRPGGLGGLDIYRVRRLPNGEWGKAENMKAFNTQYDEETPILHPNGKVMYFSSEGHNSMGQFDIFYSVMDDEGNWGPAINMGYPINTPDDDFFFVPTATPNIAYYASARYDDNLGGSDIYLVEYEEPEINRLVVIKGCVNSTNEAPIENVQILVKKQGESESAGVYKPHPGTGKYVLILEAEGKYNIEYKGTGFESQEKTIDVTREMTYKSTNQTFDIDDVMLVAIPQPEVTETKLLADDATEATYDTSDGIPYYTVQILALKKPIASYDIFVDLEQDLIKEYKCTDGFYRYAYGSFKGYKASLKGKDKVLKTGLWSDSFIRDIKQYDQLTKE